MGQTFTRNQKRREEQRREEQRMMREIDQALNEGMRLASILSAELFSKPLPAQNKSKEYDQVI
jgi:hypothetical protein